jgi:hypothetical protein
LAQVKEQKSSMKKLLNSVQAQVNMLMRKANLDRMLMALPSKERQVKDITRTLVQVLIINRMM